MQPHLPDTAPPPDLDLQAQRLLVRFFHGLDERREAAVAGSLSDDAVWLRQGQMARGMDAVLAVVRGRPAAMRTRHLVSNVLPLDPLDWTEGEAGARFRQAWGCGDAAPEGRWFSACLTAFRVDSAGPAAYPYALQGVHKVSALRLRLVQAEAAWRMGALLMLEEFKAH